MIFYFTGTGNSGWVAEYVAQEIGDELKFIPDEFAGNMRYRLRPEERLGFIFPCYGWGVPVFVEQFIERMQLESAPSYVYFVTTCGDDTGKTAEIFCKNVERKGWKCNLGYAVQMPESYVCLPGFDVDPKDKEQMKLRNAQVRLEQIVDDIIDKRELFDTIPGGFKWAKSHIIRPFFNRFLITSKHFKTNDNCRKCGKCVKVCPYHNITLDGDKLPEWGKECVQCMRCYHSCESRAIEWGVFTKNKGQYLFKNAK